MVGALSRVVLQLLLLPQMVLWILASTVFDLCAEVLNGVFVRPAMNALLWLQDRIDGCLEVVEILFDIWKELSSVLLDVATRPVKSALFLCADCVDWCLQPLLPIVDFVTSSLLSTFTALISPFKPLQQLLPDPRSLVPFELGRVFPISALAAFLPFEIGSIGSVGPSQQVPGFGSVEKGEEGEKVSETMSSTVTAGPVHRMLKELTLTRAEPIKEHKKVEDYSASIASALCQSLFKYLSEEEGTEAVSKLLEQYSVTFQEVAVTEDSKNTSYTVGAMGILGAYDGGERKVNELTSKLPAAVKSAFFPVLAGYAALFASGLLLSLLRFSFYGIH